MAFILFILLTDCLRGRSKPVALENLTLLCISVFPFHCRVSAGSPHRVLEGDSVYLQSFI